MRKRSRARELAVKILYQADVGGRSPLPADELEEFFREAAVPEDVATFARQLVGGFWDNREAIDEKLQLVSHNWKLDRMAVVDRNILRLAAYEILFREDIPALVSINEAIEIAKKFSTAKSGSFVNGVLDSLRKNYAPAKSAGRPPPVRVEKPAARRG